MSPAVVAEYQTVLPDKKLLKSKLHEFYELARQQMEMSSESRHRLPAALPRKRIVRSAK